MTAREDGFLNLLKPPGMSSHDVVGCARRVLGMKKVGHAGTLDPGAAGVLPVAAGAATRLIEYLEHAEKSYRAEMLLGVATDSGDLGGEVVARQAVSMPAASEVEQALAAFRGEISQVPPAHSAIKIGGRRAYERLRAGETVELPARRVTIHRLELLALDAARHTLLLDVDCSRGTYIRSLCRDIGKRLGMPAVMSFLVRTRVGDFSLTEALTLEEFAARGRGALEAPEERLSGLPRYDLPRGRARAFCNGLPTHDISLAMPEAARLRVYGEGQFLGIGRVDAAAQSVVPEKVLPRS